MASTTLQSADRPQATQGAASSAKAYEGFVNDLKGKLRENASFHQMAADPVMRPKMLNTVRNSLIGAVPDFQRLNDTDQLQFTERALTEALQPTTGERVQSTIEGFAPIVAPSVAAATGASIPLVAGAAAAGAVIPELTRPFTTGEAPDFIGGIRRAATNAALTAVGEKIIRPIGSAIGAFRSKQVLGEGPALEQTTAARKVLEPGLTEKGFFLTPKQLSREHLPPVTEFIENVAESGLGGRGIMQAQRRATDEVIGDAAVALQQNLERGLATNEDAATMFLNHAHGRELYLRTISSMKHRVVDEINKKGVTVPAKSVIDIAGLRSDPTTKSVLSNFKVPELRDPSGKLIRPGYSGADGFYEMLNGAGPRQVAFGDADRARSALLEIARDFGGPTASGGDKQVARLAGNMAERLRMGMDTAARKLDPKAADAYAAAKEFHKTQVIEQFDDAIYKGIIKSVEKEPGKFAQYALSPENVDKLKVLKQMSGEGELGAWPEVQGRLLQHIVSRSVEKESLGLGLELNQVVEQGLLRKISGDSIRSSVKALGAEGEKLLLGGPAGEAFRKFTNALEVGAARPEGPGKIGTILMQFGAMTTLGAGAGGVVGGLLSGGDWAGISQGAGVGAAAVLLTPRAFAKIMTNEKLMRNMADGIIGGPKSTAFGRMVVNVGLLNDEIQRGVGGSVATILNQSTAPQANLSAPSQLSQGSLPSYATGTSYVPQTGMAQLHQGEMVIPKQQADDIRQGSLPNPTPVPTVSPRFNAEGVRIPVPGEEVTDATLGGQHRNRMIQQLQTLAPHYGTYGTRSDGTPKGTGYFGELPIKGDSQGYSTELSVTGQINGKRQSFPLLVPTLTRQEIAILTLGDASYAPQYKTTIDTIYEKARLHAQQRLEHGQSPYADVFEFYPVPLK